MYRKVDCLGYVGMPVLLCCCLHGVFVAREACEGGDPLPVEHVGVTLVRSSLVHRCTSPAPRRLISRGK